MLSKPPIGFHGKTGTGALTALSAVGAQDPFLYCKKKNTPFDYKHKEFTEGNTFYKVYRPIQDRYLGTELRHIFRPKEMGDVLSGMLLSYELPSATAYNTKGLINHGYAIIEKARLLLDGEEIQSMDGDFMGIYESMYSSEVDRQNTLNFMANMNFPYDTETTYPRGTKKQRIVIPLPFFFNSHYEDAKIGTKSFRSPMPLCALYNSEITLVIRFKTLEQIVDTPANLNGTDLSDIKFITEETVLSAAERNQMREQTIKFPIEKITKENFEFVYREEVSPKKYVYQFNFTYFFNSMYSCRALMWYFKEKSTGFNPDFYTPITDATMNTLKKTDRGEARDKIYYQQYQAYTHGYHCNKLFYSVSFSEQPLQVILGDYEFKAPKPQSAYININMRPDNPDSYVFWSDVYDPEVVSDYVVDRNIILNTSVGLGTPKFLNSIRAINGGFLRLDQVTAGIPYVSYTSTAENILPYTLRFNPWDYRYTRNGVEYTSDARPAPTYYYDGTIRIDASFSYAGSIITAPAWSNAGNTEALILINNDGLTPQWGIYSGNVYSLTDGQAISVTPIANSWQLGYYYPSDSGSISYGGFIKIGPGSKLNVNTSVKVVDIYTLSFYYFSTSEMVYSDGKAKVNS